MLFQYKENDELVCSVYKAQMGKKVAEQLKIKESLAIALWLRRFGRSDRKEKKVEMPLFNSYVFQLPEAEKYGFFSISRRSALFILVG
jgi:hypothetical protein